MFLLFALGILQFKTVVVFAQQKKSSASKKKSTSEKKKVEKGIKYGIDLGID